MIAAGSDEEGRRTARELKTANVVASKAECNCSIGVGDIVHVSVNGSNTKHFRVDFGDMNPKFDLIRAACAVKRGGHFIKD